MEENKLRFNTYIKRGLSKSMNL